MVMWDDQGCKPDEKIAVTAYREPTAGSALKIAQFQPKAKNRLTPVGARLFSLRRQVFLWPPFRTEADPGRRLVSIGLFVFIVVLVMRALGWV